MARRTNKADETSTAIEETPVMTDTATEPTTDEPTADVEPNEDNSTADNSATAIEAEPKFQVPANVEDLDLGEMMASMAGQRYLGLVRAIQEIDSTLRAQDESDTSNVVLTFADEIAASASDAPLTDEEQKIADILNSYREIETLLSARLAELTSAVKEHRGELTLSEEDIVKLKTKRGETVELAKTAHKFLDSLTNSNDFPEIGKFLEAVTIPGARKSSGKSGTGATKYESSTSARPRLSNSGATGNDRGYIEIDGSKFDKFTDAIKWLKGNNVNATVGDLHKLWAQNGWNGEISDWQNSPETTEFQLDDKSVKIVFRYTPPTK